MIDEYECSICKKIGVDIKKRLTTWKYTYYICQECDRKHYYIHTDDRLLHRLGFGLKE